MYFILMFHAPVFKKLKLLFFNWFASASIELGRKREKTTYLHTRSFKSKLQKAAVSASHTRLQSKLHRKCMTCSFVPFLRKRRRSSRCDIGSQKQRQSQKNALFVSKYMHRPEHPFKRLQVCVGIFTSTQVMAQCPFGMRVYRVNKVPFAKEAAMIFNLSVQPTSWILDGKRDVSIIFISFFWLENLSTTSKTMFFCTILSRSVLGKTTLKQHNCSQNKFLLDKNDDISWNRNENFGVFWRAL